MNETGMYCRFCSWKETKLRRWMVWMVSRNYESSISARIKSSDWSHLLSATFQTSANWDWTITRFERCAASNFRSYRSYHTHSLFITFKRRCHPESDVLSCRHCLCATIVLANFRCTNIYLRYRSFSSYRWMGTRLLASKSIGADNQQTHTQGIHRCCRPTIIHKLPTLRFLDGREIHPTDRQRAAALFQLETTNCMKASPP